MKSQPLTDDVRKAIWNWYQTEKLTQIKIGKLLGIHNSAVNAWLNGTAKTIRPRNWQKLYPLIQKYLPANFNTTNGESSQIVNGHHAVGINNGTITQNCLDTVFDKILASEKLSDEEKVKVLKVLKE